MNKKGFTLVELLAVVVLLGLLATVGVVAVTNIIKSANETTDSINHDTAINAAYDAYLKDKFRLDASGKGKISVNKLINIGYLKSEIVTGEESATDANQEKHLLNYCDRIEVEKDGTLAAGESDKDVKFFGKYKFKYIVDETEDCKTPGSEY